MPTTTATARPSPELAPILEGIRQRLLALPPDALHEAGVAAGAWVARSFTRKGVRTEPVAFTARFPDGAAVVKALKKGSLEILECALWILAVVDRAAALERALAVRALPPPVLTGRSEYERNDHFEALVRARALVVVSRSADLLPLTTVLALLGRGDASFDEAAIARHPELATGDAILAALQATQQYAAGVSERCGARTRPRDAALAFALLGRLGALRHDPAVPVLERLFRDARHDLRTSAGEALLAIGSGPALAALARAVEDGMFDAADPNLPSRATALRGLFRLDPARAYDRLARYLDPATITAEPARTMMSATIQVLALDRRTAADGPAPCFYDADPRWAALVATMAERAPEWERYAWSFQDLSPAELDQELQAWSRRHGGLAGPPPP